ncbi:MAG: hypothetical protein N2V75_10595 [Methanophagales archaeon]|nr:hypothetical protein [Methanophagales archaeon]
MGERWFIYNMYPKGKRVQNTFQELNDSLGKLLRVLRNENLTAQYKYFTLFYPNRIKFGVKTERVDIKKIENTMKSKIGQNLVIDVGSENDENAELATIATEYRTALLKKFPDCSDDKTALMLHFMLNPFGYDREARIYLLSLIQIESKIANQDIKDCIARIKEMLEERGLLEHL